MVHNAYHLKVMEKDIFGINSGPQGPALHLGPGPGGPTPLIHRADPNIILGLNHERNWNFLSTTVLLMS